MGGTGLKSESWRVKDHIQNTSQQHFDCFLKEIWILESSCSLGSPTHALALSIHTYYILMTLSYTHMNIWGGGCKGVCVKERQRGKERERERERERGETGRWTERGRRSERALGAYFLLPAESDQQMCRHLSFLSPAWVLGLGLWVWHCQTEQRYVFTTTTNAVIIQCGGDTKSTCSYVDPVLRLKHHVQSWIKIGGRAVLIFRTPASLSMPEMESMSMPLGIPFFFENVILLEICALYLFACNSNRRWIRSL